MAQTRKAKGTPPWKAPPKIVKPSRRSARAAANQASRTQRAGAAGDGESDTRSKATWRDRLPEPHEPDEQEAARRKRANRRVGHVILAVCLLVAAIATAVFLTMNGDSRDLGAPTPAAVHPQR